MIKVRNRTLVSSYENQIKKYLPELSKIFHEWKPRYIEEVVSITKYTKHHVWELMTILKELGWVNSSPKDKWNKKTWILTEYGKDALEEYNDSK